MSAPKGPWVKIHRDELERMRSLAKMIERNTRFEDQSTEPPAVGPRVEMVKGRPTPRFPHYDKADWKIAYEDIQFKPTSLKAIQLKLTDREVTSLERRFNYHAPNVESREKFELIRKEALELAKLLYGLCPRLPELANAVNRLEECMFHANAAIARRSS